MSRSVTKVVFVAVLLSISITALALVAISFVLAQPEMEKRRSPLV